MSVELMARRYALALADVVEKTGEAQTLQSELGQWEAMMKDSTDMSALFRNPAIPYEKKSKVLESLIAKTSPLKTTANFLRVLLRNQRLGNLSAVNRAFTDVLGERSNAVSAFITTAHELSADQKKNLQDSLNKKTGREVSLTTAVDSEIIGGMITRIGSTVYDSSVKTQLADLKNQLIKG
jgi:F-type H+-transporting ATPase subunit delta